MSEQLTKQLVKAGITNSRDGLLRDFVARGLYQAAIQTAGEAIERREAEILALERLIENLMVEISKEE